MLMLYTYKEGTFDEIRLYELSVCIGHSVVTAMTAARIVLQHEYDPITNNHRRT